MSIEVDVSRVMDAVLCDCNGCVQNHPHSPYCLYCPRHGESGPAVERAAKLAVIEGVIAVLRAMPCPAPHEAVCGTVEAYEAEANRLRGETG